MKITEARMLYKTTCETKDKLESDFGRKILSDNVMDRIKTYEDCCEETGDQPVDESALEQLGFTDDEIAYRVLKTITKAINEGHEPDMLDTGEKKWFPVFKIDKSSPSGFVFYCSHYNYALAGAGDASRLCFKSEALASFAGKTFLKEYIRYINSK